MTRTILSLFLAFGLFMCIGAVSGGADAYSGDFVKKYAGKYFNATNTTTSDDKSTTEAADKDATTEVPISDAACAQTLNKTNEAIAQFAESVGTAKDKWSLLGSISRLGGQSYSLQFNCKPENLQLVNVGEVGVNKTQDKACEKLIQIIQPLLIKSADAPPSAGGFEASLNLSQQALGISKKLGDKCSVSMVDITQEAEEEEATVEESNEEWESLEEDEEDNLVIQVVDAEGNLVTIYPLPAAEEGEVEEDLSEEEEEEAASSDKAEFLSFIQSKSTKDKPSSNPYPNPWADVDYKGKYTGNSTGSGNYTAIAL